MEYQHWTIREAMNRITAKKLYLPAIQRKFVWDSDQIEKLFDSIMRDYPIGTFLFWMVEEAKHNDYAFYEFIRDFHARDNWRNALAAKPHLPDELIGVLDGQQRLNSMYVALQGSYAYKRPRVWANNPNAFPVRSFFLNVFKPEAEEDGQEFIYEFRFLTSQESEQSAAGICWCEVKQLLECKGLAEVNRFWAKRKKTISEDVDVSDEMDERALDILGKLFERLTTIPIINYFPVKNQNLDEIVDIFIRVNSGGTPLAKTDLLFSTIVAQWEDGREEIQEFLGRLNERGSGFAFDIDFMMRGCLVLANCPVRLRVASFKAANVKLIVEQWDDITSALETAVGLLVEWGFQGETLSSMNAVIPIAYAIKRGCDLNASKDNLRLLLIKSLLTGVYGSSGDQVLTAVRRAIDDTIEAHGKFELSSFEKLVRLPSGNSFVISEDMFDTLLHSTKGPRTFALLSLLAPHLKFNQVQFHQDHIHPRAGFSTHSLKKLGLDDATIQDWQARRDALPNLQLLEGGENQSKLKTPIDIWLKKEYPNEIDRRHFNAMHHIPDVSLDQREFDKFFESRKQLLKTKLTNLLQVTSG